MWKSFCLDLCRRWRHGSEYWNTLDYSDIHFCVVSEEKDSLSLIYLHSLLQKTKKIKNKPFTYYSNGSFVYKDDFDLLLFALVEEWSWHYNTISSDNVNLKRVALTRSKVSKV